MLIRLRLVLETEKEAAAKRVMSRFRKTVSCSDPTFEPYHTGGTQALTTLPVQSQTWDQAVVETLTVSQSFGNGWVVTGDVTRELDLVAKQFSITGIRWAHVTLHRGAVAEGS